MQRKTLTVAAAAALLLLLAAVPALGSNGTASLENLIAAFDQLRTEHKALQLRVSILEQHIFEAMAIMGTPTATPTPDPQATPTPKTYGYRILESSLVVHDDIPLGLIVVETDGYYSQQLGKDLAESIVRLGLIAGLRFGGLGLSRHRCKRDLLPLLRPRPGEQDPLRVASNMPRKESGAWPRSWKPATTGRTR